MMPAPYDVIVVGAGPAGLSAALVLSRCLRKVLIIDAGHPRNYASRSAHNFLTRDGIHPREFLEIARREVECHGVDIRQGVVAHAELTNPGFVVDLLDGDSFRCRKLLLATGMKDALPDIEHAEAFYGLGLHHCPYCDAYAYAGKPLATYGHPKKAWGLALSLRAWTDTVTACSNGDPFSKSHRRHAARLGVTLRDDAITRLEALLEITPRGPIYGNPPQAVSVEGSTDEDRNAQQAPASPVPHRLGRICFADGPPLEVAALFFNTHQAQRSDLPAKLGCVVKPEGGIARDARQRTCVEDLYIAGDASRDVQFLVVAAAEGARAAVAINTDFQRQAQGLKWSWPVITPEPPATGAEPTEDSTKP